MGLLSHLECGRCKKEHAADRLQTVCTDCGKALLCVYDLGRVASQVSRDEIRSRPPGMLRFREILPMRDEDRFVSLGESATPLLPLDRIGDRLGLRRVWVKEEGRLPTGSFKARGLSMAVSRAVELGIRQIALPTAGNAGGAAAAYGARAGMDVFVFMPRNAPSIHAKECHWAGAHVFLVEGFIGDAARFVAAGVEKMGWFDLSTLKEPYRIEGKKTMGLELALDFDWKLPDIIVYPTGGGTGMIGMWRGFRELREMGWLSGDFPRMVSVQAEGCAPIVSAFDSGSEESEAWKNPETIAAGLRVPKAFGDFLILEVLRESGGRAIAVSDQEILESVHELGRLEGLVACPEGAACLAAVRRMRAAGEIGSEEEVVIFNTAEGQKYPEMEQLDLPVLRPGMEGEWIQQLSRRSPP